MAQNNKYTLQQERAAQVEAHLEQIAPDQLSMQHRLELLNIITLLTLPQEIAGDTEDNRSTQVELRNLKNNLNRRTKLSDKLTSKALNNLSPNSEALLFSELALLFKDDLDNWAQIDFNDYQHVAHLSTGIDNAILKIANPKGRRFCTGHWRAYSHTQASPQQEVRYHPMLVGSCWLRE